MNKKFYLGAILLGAMTLSTGALTSCIDNDEPEGITNLRGAKAELLRAKAALELAEAEVKKQQANVVAAEVKIQEAIAKQQEAIAKRMEAEAEAAKAQTEAAKAEAELKIEQAKLAIEESKAYHEAALMDAKTALAESQVAYERALKELELAKSTLTPEQQEQVATLQGNVTTALGNLARQQKNVEAASRKIFEAKFDGEEYIAGLEEEVANAEAKLAAVNSTYGELKALAENLTPTAWEARKDSLKAFVDDAPLQKKKLNLAYQDALNGATELKEKALEDRTAYVRAQQYYNYLADPDFVAHPETLDCFDDCLNEATSRYGTYGKMGEETTHDPAKWQEVGKPATYGFAEIKIKLEDNEKFIKYLTKKGVTVDSDWDGTPILKIAKVNSGDNGAPTYSAISTAFAWNDSFNRSLSLTSWKKLASDFNVTAEEIEADTCKIAPEWTVDSTTTVHNKAVENFKAMHKQYQTGKKAVDVPTTGIKTAMEAYNTAHTALKTAVEAYNTKFDEVFETAKNKKLQTFIEPHQLAVYKTIALALESAEFNGAGLNFTGINTIAEADGYINSKNSAIMLYSSDDWNAAKVIETIKTKSNYINAYEDRVDRSIREANETTAKAYARSTANTALATSGTDLYKAQAAYVEAETKLGEKRAALAKAITNATPGANEKIGYVEELAEAAQVVTSEKGINIAVLEGIKGIKDDAIVSVKYPVAGNKVGEETGIFSNTLVVDAVKQDSKGEKWESVDNHKMVATTGINIENALKAAAGKLDPSLAERVWQKASIAAFGEVRHTELTVAMVKETKVNTTNKTVTFKNESGVAIQRTDASQSTLGMLLIAKAIEASHVDLASAKAAADSLVAAVDAEIAKLKEAIKPITEAVNAAYAEIAPAKKAHQASYKAWTAVGADFLKQKEEIKAKEEEYEEIIELLDKVIKAYYKNLTFSWVTVQGELKEKTFDDFEDAKEWLDSKLAEFEGTLLDKGKIKKAEEKLATAQKTLEKAVEGGDYGDGTNEYIAYLKMVLEQEQAKLEHFQAIYEFAVKSLNDYIAALTK